MLSSAFAFLALLLVVAAALFLAWTAVRSLPLAFIGAAALLAFAALALRRLQRAHPAAVPAPLALEWPAGWALAVAGGAFALVIHGALKRNFFDEEAHVPFALVIARGVVPPEHVFAPGQT